MHPPAGAARLRSGQVRGLRKMIEAGTWRPDVVTQVGSATRALPAATIRQVIRL